jgi:hypothetical protein
MSLQIVILQDNFQSISQNLCNNLINATYQINRMQIFYLNNPYFFRNKENEGCIQNFKKLAVCMELKKDLHNIFDKSIENFFGPWALPPPH